MQKRRSNLIRASKEAKLPRSNHDVKKGRGFVIVVAMLAVFLFATHLSGSLLYFYGIVEPAMKNIKDSESSPEPEDQRDTCFGGCPINQSSARNQILNFPNNTNEFILGPTKKRRTFLHDSAGEKRTIFARNDTFFLLLTGPFFTSPPHPGRPSPTGPQVEAELTPPVCVWDSRSWTDKNKNFE